MKNTLDIFKIEEMIKGTIMLQARQSRLNTISPTVQGDLANFSCKQHSFTEYQGEPLGKVLFEHLSLIYVNTESFITNQSLMSHLRQAWMRQINKIARWKIWQ